MNDKHCMSVKFCLVMAFTAFVAVGLGYSPVAMGDNTSIGKQRPQANEIKQKVYTLIQGKLQEDRVATMMKQAHDQTVKNMKENSLNYTNTDTYNLKTSYQKVAEMKRQTDEHHRKVIMDKIALKTKMTQMKIEKMVKEGKLGKPEQKAKQFEYGRTQ